MLKDHEEVVFGPETLIRIPPRHYCIVGNPAVREGKEPQLNEFGEVRILFGETEVRTYEEWKEPFPLQHNERIEVGITAYKMIAPETAFRLECQRPFTDDGVERIPGEQWLHFGPGTYIPRIEEKVVAVEKAITIKQNQALKVQAIRDFTDKAGTEHKAGEEWLVRTIGSYFPCVDERTIEIQDAYILTEKQAIQVAARENFKDAYGIERKAG